jgi:Arc/MetJ-type ribon-helix-helix transcriptional regulator
MSEGANLADGREELKRQLAAGEYASSIDVILEGVGRILQKLTRRTKPPAP